MAYVFTKNQLPTSGAAYFYLLKTLLVSCGWTVTRSGTGTGATYSAAGDLITSAGVLANPGAWFCIKQPAAVAGGQRSLIFQNEYPTITDVTNDVNWRIKYSYNVGFITGTSNATTTPSASDEQILVGSGTDAAPVYSLFALGPSMVSRRAHFIANNAAPYEFAAVMHPSGGGAVSQIFMMDAMVANSFDVLDVDPYVFYIDSAGPLSNTYFRGYGNAACLKAWYKKGLSGAAFQNCAALVYVDGNATTLIPGVIGVDPQSSKDQVYPVFYGRNPAQGAPAGPKGQSSLLVWCSNARNSGDTLTVVGSKDKIVIANGADVAALPWDGTTPSV